ncbi:MAG TPA: adenylate/guanylate cyclase domain-containing protein [Planctomycetaceae bacterium]|nr:adenylate/guanylate cyclase domain-containing protein [Planctomycetaceae bacterium]
MFELLVQGTAAHERWQTELQPGRRYVIGRTAAADLVVTWDHRVSRRHAEIVLQDGALAVQRLPEARNPVLFEGRAVNECRVLPGRQFVLGTTVFRLIAAQATPGPQTPVEERAFSAQQLRRIRYHDPENRIDVLTHLPEVIAGSQSDAELYERLVRLLLRGVTHAEAVAIVSCRGEDGVITRYWERRRETAGELRPSRRLVYEAIQRQRTSVLHVWTEAEDQATAPTMGQEFDWAFCTPVSDLADEPAGLYVAGQIGALSAAGATLSENGVLEADVKFTELVAEIIASVLKSRRLERQRAGLRQFFAPPILSALGDELDTTLLEPRECDVTVMFCDLRGFSQRAEHEADNLLGLLDRVSRALGVMTQHILENGGVTGDFQGDAALGFWGWPIPTPDAAVQACRAALGIRAAFQRAAAQPDHPLADFSMGIGIAHGRAVAGKIGTHEQVKVTVFGPVVNLAHRLEGMTKWFRAPILLDDAAATVIRARMSSDEGRLRRLARVLPFGLETPVVVSELLPPVADLPELTDEHLAAFERGVEGFITGRWEEAYRALHTMPPGDRVQDFLLAQIMQQNRKAPLEWDGTVRLPGK